MKRFLKTALIGMLVIVLLLAGAAAAKKAYSMYRNVWLRLDALYASASNTRVKLDDISQTLEALGTEVDQVAQKTDSLHRETFFSAQNAGNTWDYSWMEGVPPYIAHACGGIENREYTNSREAFELNYQLGQRVFEIDFNLTQDGVLVASHDEYRWREMVGGDGSYVSEQFNQLALYGKYETLNCAEVVELMADHPDVYIVTDTKDQSLDRVMLAFHQLVHCARQTHPEVLERIVPQIYNEEMLTWVTSIYPFESFIFTLYATEWTMDSVLAFCMDSGVRFITMPVDAVTPEHIRLWDTLGIHVAVHTVNDREYADELIKMGVDMIYTDYITPDQES